MLDLNHKSNLEIREGIENIYQEDKNFHNVPIRL
jgi:hypothetical protein